MLGPGYARCVLEKNIARYGRYLVVLYQRIPGDEIYSTGRYRSLE